MGEAFNGEIGHNMFYTKEEREEDVLEIYNKYNIIKKGEKEYVIRAGTLDLNMEEGNELTLESVIPLEDEEGMKLNGFTFSLTNNGNIESDYSIYLDDIEFQIICLNR